MPLFYILKLIINISWFVILADKVLTGKILKNTHFVSSIKTAQTGNQCLIFQSLFDKSQTGFDLSEGGDWGIVEAANSNSISRSANKYRGGTHSVKFILNKYDANVGGSKRAELTDWNGRMLNVRSERWYGLSIFLPDSYIADPCEEQLFQWHATNSVAMDGESMLNSPMAMYTKNGRWQFGMKHGGSLDLGVYERNVWTDWVLHIKFSPDSNGLVEIWKNGIQMTSKRGKNTYNDKVGNYFKIGIYKYGWAEGYYSNTNTRTLYYDEVRIGDENSSYSAVAPRSKQKH